MHRRILIALALCASALFAASGAIADEIRIIASNVVKEAVVELTPAFEQQSGHRLQVDWGGTVDIARRLERGETFGLAILPVSVVDELERKGVLRAGSRRDFVESVIGAAVAPGAARRDIASAAGLRQSLLDARSVVLSSGPSSLHLLALFKQFGIEAQMAPKLTRLAPGLSVGEALARSEAELGFTQVSELLHIHGIGYLGPLGPEVQRPTVFAFAVPATAPPGAASVQLIDHFTSTAAAPVLRQRGLNPR